MAAIAWALKRWFDHWVTPSVQLAEEAQVLLRTDVVRELKPKGNVETKVLADLFNQLVGQREELRRQMDDKVRAAAQGIEQEKSRLAALMSELTQSVVVCNLDGRILLYNNRARMQFKALSQAPGVAGGAELIGLGRSIYSVFDRKLVAHALDNIQQRMLRGRRPALGPVRDQHRSRSAAAGADGAGAVTAGADGGSGRRPCRTDRLCAHARQHHPRL
jgi:DNA polymerase III subunit epsilon